MNSSISTSKSLALELSQSKNLLLFPSPNYEKITFQQAFTAEGFWEIRNSRGKRVKFGIVEGYRQEIPIKDLANGVYLFSLYRLEGEDVNRTSFIKFTP